MPLTLRKPLPVILMLLAAALAVAATLVLDDRATSVAPPAPPVLEEIPYADREPASLTTEQLIERYTAELRLRPTAAEVYVNLALAELQAAREDGDPSRYTRAERLFSEALRHDRENAAGLGGLGSLALSRHAFRAALDFGNRALAVAPDSGYALGVIVDAQIELGRYGDARRTLVRMLDLRPDLASYSRASYFLELHGRTGQARRALRQAIAAGAPAGENTAWAHLYLGNLEFNHGRYAAAQRSYAEARRVLPGFVHADAAIARLAAARGDLDAAVSGYERVVQRLPQPSYVIALADVYGAAGMKPEARRTEQLVRAEQALYAANGVNVDVELALFEVDHGGDAAMAARLLSDLAASQPSVVVQDALAWALHKAGRDTEALTAADRALRLGGDDPSFLFHRGTIRAALGMREGARSDLRRALRLNPHFSVMYETQARRLLAEVSR